MSWSDPAKLVVSKPVFKVVGSGKPKKAAPVRHAKKPATAATKRISGTGFTIDVPTTWQRNKEPTDPGAIEYRDPSRTVTVSVESTTISAQQAAAAVLSTFQTEGVKSTSSDVTLPAGKAVYVSGAKNGKYSFGYFVQGSPNTWVVGFVLPQNAYAKNRALIGKIVASFALR
jgi:hypothetical protein